jgi:hypothetical protein
VLTVNGRLRLRRVRWYLPQQGTQTPTDRLLDEAEATISQGVREMACRLNQGATSFQQTAENLQRAAHLGVSKETLRELIEAEAKQVQRQFQRGELSADWTAEDCRTPSGTTRVYEGCDGVKVPLITDQEKQKRRAKVRQKRRLRGRPCKPLPRPRQGADLPYKEFRIVNFYDESQEHRYVGVTRGNHEATGRLMQRMACQIDLATADEKIANIDGAPWIRNQIELHGVVDHIGLDFYHLQENVQKARRSVFGEDSEEGRQWLDALMHAFHDDGYNAAWDSLVSWRSTLRGPKREAADRLIHFVAERRPMIRYPAFRARGWQIGSGPTEAECKTTTHRVKGRGRRWDSANAEAMMALACLHDSRLWDNHWVTPHAERN